MSDDPIHAILSISRPRVAVLVGANGCGKSRVLGALQPRGIRRADQADVAMAHRAMLDVLPGANPDRPSRGWTDSERALLGVISSARHNVLETIDDLGMTLHPQSAGRLVAALRASGGYFLAATQSVAVVNAFDPSEVVVMHRGRAALLSRHPDIHRWGVGLRAGDIWQTVGEEWVSGLPVSA